MKKITSVLLSICFIITMFQGNMLQAKDSSIVVGAFEENGEVTVIVKDSRLKKSDVDGSISGKELENCTIQPMSESDEKLKTLILIDASKSISEPLKDNFYDLLFNIFDKASDNEEFCIGTFGKKISYVTKYTKDRFELVKGYKSIKSVKQTSYLSDILSEAIDDFNSMDEKSVKRIIVFSDGLSTSSDSVTNEQLYAKLGKTPYPIYAVGAANNNNGEELKSFYALSTITGGTSFQIQQKEKIDADAEKKLLNIEDFYVIKGQAPKKLQDGSYRPVEFVIEGKNGNITIQQDVLMGMTDTDSIEESTATTEEVLSDTSDDGTKTTSFRTLWIVIAIAVVIILLVVILWIVLSPKNNKKSKKYVIPERSVPRPMPETINREEGTTVLSSDAEDEYEETSVLGVSTSCWKIILRDNFNGKMFENNLKDEIIIGRVSHGENSVAIDYDASVSKQHCRITLQQNTIYVEDLGSSNGTYLNGKRLVSPEPLNDGDSIDIGKVNLYVGIEEL